MCENPSSNFHLVDPYILVGNVKASRVPQNCGKI